MRNSYKYHIPWLPFLAAISLIFFFTACGPGPTTVPAANPPANESPAANNGSAADGPESPAEEAAAPEQLVQAASAETLPQSSAAFSGDVDGFRYEIRDLQIVTDLDDKKIIGNVTNVGDQMFMFTRYTADFYDAAGNIVASAGPIRVSSDIHPVGITLPIWFYVDDNIEWDHYEIYVSNRGAGLGGVKVELLDLTVQPTGSQTEPCTTFTVTNHDDKIASWVTVIGRYYNQDGKLAGAWSRGLSKQFLEAGATSGILPCVHEDYPYDIQVIGYHQPNMHE